MFIAPPAPLYRTPYMQLDARSTALVLIDLQRGVLAMPVAPHAAATVYDRSMQLAQRFRTAGSPVVMVRVSFSKDFADALRPEVYQPPNYGALPANWDEFPESLSPSDIVITKRQWGAFHGTELDLQLRRRGVRRIVLGGIATNIGVESTARSAYEHGYELVVAEDLCSSTSAEMHAFCIRHIMPRIARVTDSNTIVLE
jgi:nicotinamidase-related amidase